MIRQSTLRLSEAMRRCAAIVALVAPSCLCATALGAPSVPATAPAPGVGRSKTDRATIEGILADWRARAEKLGTIHCIAEGTSTVPKGCYNGDQYVPKGVEGDVPAADHTYDCRHDWLFDFKNARFRIEKKSESFHMQKLIFVPDVEICASDGASKPTTLAPRDLNTSADYTPGANQPEAFLNNQGPTLTTPDLLVLFAHGTVPAHGVAVWPANIGAALSAAGDYVVHGRAERDGLECVVLRSVGKRPTSFTEYWVDLARQSAIVHWESRASKRKLFEADIVYEQVAGIWLPKAIDYTKYTARPENPPELLCRMTITEMLPNAPVRDEMVKVKPKEGVVVWDGATQERYRFGSRPTAESPGLAWPIAALVLFVAAAVIAWRRRHKRTRRVL